MFAADGLSLLLEERVQRGELSPVRVCRQAPGISHLLFADDTLLFFSAEERQAEVVKEVLESYALSTGQLINPTKCSIMFGSATQASTCNAIKRILQITHDSFDDKYLGFPTPEGRMNKGKFQTLQSRIWKRIVLWGEIFLSTGGKEVLIKAVIQAIPVYVMGLFKLSDSICDELTKLSRNFWWGSEQGKRKTCWKSWESMTKPKCNGGLGFRDFKIFNQALLARQAWRLLMYPDSLCARVLKAKYYPNGSLIDTCFGGNASPGWRATKYGVELLKKGIIWREGNGRSIRCWRDPWIPRDHTRRPITKRGNCRLKWVSDFITENDGWDTVKVQQNFWPVDAETILNIRISSRSEEDCVAWHPDKWGIFSVRSAYKLGFSLKYMDESCSSSPAGLKSSWNLIWKCNIPQKIKIFAWKAASNSLPTRENKCHRKMDFSSICQVCGTVAENTIHALCHCPLAGSLWRAMKESGCVSVSLDDLKDSPNWIFDHLEHLPDSQRAQFLMILWRNWHVRNEIIHGKAAPPIEVISLCLESNTKSKR